MRTHPAVRVGVTVGVGAAGLVTMVVGTFLPWLDSGERSRNVYRAGGTLRRLLGVHGFTAIGLDVLPFMALWCALVAAVFAFGYRRTACVGALLAGAAGLAVGIGALASPGKGLVKAAPAGPIVTVVGAIMIVSAASVLLLPGRDRRLTRSAT